MIVNALYEMLLQLVKFKKWAWFILHNKWNVKQIVGTAL